MEVNRIIQGNNMNKPIEVNVNQGDNLIKQPESIDVVNKQDNKQNNKNSSEQYNKKELDKALSKLNKFLEDESVHAEYSMHKDLNRLMIKIVDDNNKSVILEIPSQKILDMVASMCEQVGLIDKKA